MEQPLSRNARRTATVALAVGAASILLSFLVGFLAYRTSRSEVMGVVARQNLATSRTVVNESIALQNLMSRSGAREHPLHAVEQMWRRAVPPVPGSYLCVIRAPGTPALHTMAPDTVGKDVSQVVVNRRPAAT
jgi:hypothetical protein